MEENLNYREGLKRMWRQGKPCWIILAVILIGSILFRIYAKTTGPVFFFNDSRSAPIGIYVKTCDQRLSYGDYVNVRLPVNIPALHVDTNTLLLKRITGFPGDPYIVTKDKLIIHGQSYPIANYSYLPHLAPGKYTVPEGQILFINPPPISMDGRYLGPIPMENIEEKVTLLINVEDLLNSIENTIPMIKRLGSDQNVKAT